MSSLRGSVRWHGIYGCGLLHHSLFQHYIRQQTTANDYSRLQTFNQRIGLDKGCIFAAEYKNNRIMEKEQFNNELPELVKTNLIGTRHYFSIPTNDVIDYRVRRAIILKAYDMLLRKNGGKLYVHNDFLGTDIEITRRISRKKASNNSVRHWQSTYAILKIIDVVKYASADEIIHLPAKAGMQQNSGFSYIIPLEYTFKHPTKTYLNFTVELIVGEIVLEKQGRRYVQYSIELMEIKKAESS